MMRKFIPLVVPLLLAGCAGKDMSDLHNFVDEVKSRPASGIEPIPEVKQVIGFVYTAKNRRDPFTRQEDEAVATETVLDNGIRPDPNRRKEELEVFALDSLRMVGTLEQNEETWGLIKTSDGTIHRVAPGNYMGQNDGRITRISEDKIELIELVPTGSGFLEKEAAVALGEE
ncbi:MAG: pilus assembly protein PilP [Gammaproteobacteria bacterium]|nr:pilus assembly protein PilP [Gammaproteobacteria bacterium]MCB1819008.1 pilus assembly protein PilP [Gammaproteobacteria bacterium]MCP5317298.1 pilus assembly protein PilP [Chromatiaceae bacterium]MCP5438142.1 pilus assembly protein PilP [Chromatiaceae bacterium]